MIKLSMNKILSQAIVVNLVVIMTLSYFYYRDVVAAKTENGEGCTPYDVSVNNIDKNSAKISWKTGSSCTSYIKFGLLSDDIDQTLLGLEGYSASKEHSASLESLKPDTTYYLTFFSNGEIYGDRGKPYEVRTSPF